MSLKERRKKLGNALGSLKQRASILLSNQKDKVEEGPSSNPTDHKPVEEAEHSSNTIKESTNLGHSGSEAKPSAGANLGSQLASPSEGPNLDCYIHKVPPEILAQILYSQQSRYPERRLALVCRRWKDVLLNSAVLWNTLYAYFPNMHQAPKERSRLQRRIELSRGVLLNVILDASIPPQSSISYDLFELVASTGVERWKTLELWHSDVNCPIEGIDQLFATGQFISLQSLFLKYDKGQDYFSSISQLIVQSKPRIDKLNVWGTIPEIYCNPEVFGRTETVIGDADAIGQLRGLKAMKIIEVKSARFEPSPLPPLPNRAVFKRLYRGQLLGLDRTRVRDLEVDEWTDNIGPEILDFPALETLSIHSGVLSDIQKISAPQLQVLQLDGTSASRRFFADRWEDERFTAIAKQPDATILIKPTILRLTVDTKVTNNLLIPILDIWPQLQNMKLMFCREAPKEELLKRFTDPAAPLCPQLVDLALESVISREHRQDWESLARRMFQLRRDLPLQTIQWRWRESSSRDSGSWHTITGET